jgi:hypothetical protein
VAGGPAVFITGAVSDPFSVCFEEKYKPGEDVITEGQKGDYYYLGDMRSVVVMFLSKAQRREGERDSSEFIRRFMDFTARFNSLADNVADGTLTSGSARLMSCAIRIFDWCPRGSTG